MQFAGAVRRLSTPHWVGFYSLVALCWGALYAMQLPADLIAAADFYGADFWQAICRVEPGLAGAPSIFLMWALMSVAMMAPTAVPTFATWDDLVQSGKAPGFALLLAGFLLVWVGFAVLATLAQIALATAGLVNPIGESIHAALNAALLAAAGLYQFSALKAACLAKCRHPLTFFMQHWQSGPWRMGLRLGAVCLGCCWALMMLAFVGGTMNLLWMGGAMVLMTLEKLPSIGAVLTRPLGYGLLAVSAAVVIFNLGGWI